MINLSHSQAHALLLIALAIIALLPGRPAIANDDTSGNAEADSQNELTDDKAEGERQLSQLPNIVVTAKSIAPEKPFLDTTSISVRGREDIERFQATDLYEEYALILSRLGRRRDSNRQRR